HQAKPGAIHHAAPGDGNPFGADDGEHQQAGQRKADAHQRTHGEAAVEHDACHGKTEAPHRCDGGDDEHRGGVGDFGLSAHCCHRLKTIQPRMNTDQIRSEILRAKNPCNPCTSVAAFRREVLESHGSSGSSYSVAALLSISPFTRSTNASALTEPSALSWPRTRTLTSPASISRSPSTSWNGTFCMACSRILAFIFSLRTSTCTRTPAAFSLSPTSLAYAWCFSPIGMTTTCTGDSHTGKAPA